MKNLQLTDNDSDPEIIPIKRPRGRPPKTPESSASSVGRQVH